MVGVTFALEFEHIGFWDLRISHASNYRNGNVFIAGDAAHSHPPYGGYGVSIGFEDARNLGWKLAAELHGWAGGDLLESYSAERHPVFRSVAKDFIGRMIDDFRAFTAEYSPEKDITAFESAWKARTEADDSDVTQFLPHYAGSPIVSGDTGAESGAKGIHEVTARAGYHLAPQPLPDGEDLWEVFGDGFSLLAFGDDRNLCAEFSKASQSLGVPLKCTHIPDAGLRSAYGTEHILLRPDQFVSWTGDSPADARAILSTAIGLTAQE